MARFQVVQSLVLCLLGIAQLVIAGGHTGAIGNAIALKITPVGTSSTFGTGSADGNGYRLKLENLIKAGGNNVSYAGSVHAGKMKDNAVEAYAGRKTIADLQAAYDADFAYVYIPNVFLIMLGTDNCILNSSDPDEGYHQMGDFLTYLNGTDSAALSLVALNPRSLNATVDDCIVSLNTGVQQAASEAAAIGQKVAVVDLYSVVGAANISSDGINPTDDGYTQIASAWYDALQTWGSYITPIDPSGRSATNGG